MQDILKPLWRGSRRGESVKIKRPHDFAQLVHHMIFQMLRHTDLAVERQANYGMLCRPVPALMDVQALKQGLVSFKELLESADQQAFPKRRGRERK